MFLYLFIKNERILTENCFEGKYDVCLKINLTLTIQPQPFSSLRPAEYRRGRSKINSFFSFLQDGGSSMNQFSLKCRFILQKWA